MIFQLKTTPNRQEIGIGSILNPNHSGGLKRVTENFLSPTLDQWAPTADEVKATLEIKPSSTLGMNNPNFKG